MTVNTVIELATGNEVPVPDQYASGHLRFLYHTVVGRILLRLFFSQRWLWRLYAQVMEGQGSQKKVARTVATHNINAEQFIGDGWSSYAAFFRRQYKPEYLNISQQPRAAIAVAQGVVSYQEVAPDMTIAIKGRRYTLTDILEDDTLAAAYRGGIAVVYHLGVQHYHRYIFPDEGAILASSYRAGKLHTVSSIGSAYPVYSINSRAVTVLDTVDAGQVIMVEVGAMMAGKIHNEPLTHYKKGQEKGHFELGGSAILVLYKKDIFIPSDRLRIAHDQQKKALVMIGEAIGTYA